MDNQKFDPKFKKSKSKKSDNNKKDVRNSTGNVSIKWRHFTGTIRDNLSDPKHDGLQNLPLNELSCRHANLSPIFFVLLKSFLFSSFFSAFGTQLNGSQLEAKRNICYAWFIRRNKTFQIMGIQILLGKRGTFVRILRVSSAFCFIRAAESKSDICAIFSNNQRIFMIVVFCYAKLSLTILPPPLLLQWMNNTPTLVCAWL